MRRPKGPPKNGRRLIVASDRERNDRRGRKGGFSPNLQAGGPRRPSPSREDAAGWLWGWHAVEAAANNPDRPRPELILATAERARTLAAIRPDWKAEVVEPQEIGRRLPLGAAHNGAALRTPPLDGVTLETLAYPASGVILMLDQVTDPQNVGAILRSAAAFGARGVIMQDRHAPPLGGALAKAAAGALERVPVVRAVNLSRALEALAEAGWTSIGLDSEGPSMLPDSVNGPGIVVVLGSEGEGLRRLVAEHCDTLAAIPMPGRFESLNVASAAAIALYVVSDRLAARATGELA